VTYGNSAHTTLTSGPLGDAVRAVRVIHAIETEVLTDSEGPDGGLFRWVGPDGEEYAAQPLGGYPGRIDSRVQNPLHGERACLQKRLELVGDIPLWRTEILPVPPLKNGPWRFRAVFASNTIWRARGWFIASLEALDEVPRSSFPVAWTGDLEWEWPFAARDVGFEVQYRAADRREWEDMLVPGPSYDPATARYRLDGELVLAGLPGVPRTRHELRVTGPHPKGGIASRPVVVYPDGGGGQPVLLAQPWPNPGNPPIRFRLDVPVARTAKVSIFDLRGRLVRSLVYPAGSHLGVWDGRDHGGKAAASGTYYLRLEGSGPVTTRKVVLIH
jgi:hypothetical protein